jgi:oligopeptide transport system substrate-binding protein
MGLLATKSFFATPQHALESAARRGAGSSWIQPGNMVASGAFTLREWRPYERIVLARNPAYYDAGSVSLEHIRFLPVADGSASANLYRAGEAALCMPMSPHLMAGISGMKDVRKCPNFGAHFPVMNTRKPPFSDVRVRYALNMATDKHAIGAFFGDGRTPLKGVVPPLDGYEPAKSLPVVMDGKTYDVLSYNPEASRSLLIQAGYGPGLKFEYLYPAMPEFKPVAEILQHQWRKNLGIDLALRSQEVQAWGQTVLEVAYNGVAAWADVGGLEDPTWFLDQFRSTSTVNGTGWTDRQYDDLLAGAKAITHPGQRLRKLAECERFLLQAMPCLPLYTDVWVYLCKPFLKGITGDPFHGRMFNNARIDTNWRPS